jgi:ABC-type phosphate/phosphonate transport system substrate-binding protein/LysM repeat protein
LSGQRKKPFNPDPRFTGDEGAMKEMFTSTSRHRGGVVAITVFFGIVLFSTMAVSQTPPDEMEVVFFNPDTASQNPVDATNALQTFCNVINKKENWNIRAYFFKKQKDLDTFLDSKKVDLGILSQVYVAENYEKRHLVPFVAPVRDGKTTYRKVVIVDKASGYKDIQDLKGKVLAGTYLGEENIPFYNKVVFRGELDITTHFKEIKVVDSANSAIMAVLYGQVDAAAVTLASFTIMQDLNPQVKSKLVSIFTSAETPISPMVYFSDNIDMKRLPKLKEILLGMHNDPVGRQSMLAFQVEAWEPCSLEDLKETERILKSQATVAVKTEETGKTPVVVPGKEATPPPLAKEGAPVMSRTQAIKSDDGGKIVFNAWVTEEKPGIDKNAVTVSYSVDGAAEVKKKMDYVSGDQFSASIDFAGKKESSGSSETKYAIKPGDTLGKIAAKFLGSSKKYMVIAALNNITDPNLIQVGQELRIKTGEEKVTEVKYYVTAKDTKGIEAKSPARSQFIL